MTLNTTGTRVGSKWMRERYGRQATTADPAAVVALSYRRVSSKEQSVEGASLLVQAQQIEDYIAAKGWRAGHFYQDVLSGKTGERPDYKAMKDAAAALVARGQAVVVVAPSVDRLGRNTAEGAGAWDELERQGVQVHAIREGGPLPAFSAHIYFAMAQEDNRQRAKKVRDGKRLVASYGLPPAGPAPWGYLRRLPTDSEVAAGPTRAAVRRVLDVHPDESPAVVEAFRRADAGANLSELAAWAGALPDSVRGGRALSRTAIQKVLRSPLYVARHDGQATLAARADATAADVLTLPRGSWPSLVDDALWLRVQGRLDARQTGAAPRATAGKYLLTGHVRCPRCGAGMSGATSGANRRYMCNSERGADGKRCYAEIPTRTLDADVLARVGALMAAFADLTPGALAALERAWETLRTPQGAGGDSPAAVALRTAEARLEDLHRRRQKLIDLVSKDRITEAEFDQQTADLAPSLAIAESGVKRARTAAGAGAPEALPPLGEALRRVGGLAGALAGADTAGQRRVLADLVTTITPVKVRVGVYRAEIVWTPLGDALRRLAGSPAS